MLSPFVYWGQTDSCVSLRVELKNVINPVINLSEESLSFEGTGHGSKGVNLYTFDIKFLEKVDPKVCPHKYAVKYCLLINVLRRKASIRSSIEISSSYWSSPKRNFGHGSCLKRQSPLG